MELGKFSAADILWKRIPLEEVLRDSVYYPACYSDGRPLKFCNTIWRDRVGVNSFVYCDYLLTEEGLLRQLGTVRGYHLLAHRSLSRDEYVPEGWKLKLKSGSRKGYRDHFWQEEYTPFAHWAVFERDPDKGEEHGPERFSLLYVGGEGLATFQQLYCHYNIAPRMICFIQCWGFAGNWTDFTDADKDFALTLRRQPACVPDYVCIGSYNHISGALQIRGTEETYGVRFIDYLSRDGARAFFGKEPDNVVDGPDVGLDWVIKDGKSYILISLYCGHFAFAVYEAVNGPVSIGPILNGMVMGEKK